jgi:hypothetical protein
MSYFSDLFTAPPQDRPAEVLRWTKRLVIHVAVFGLLTTVPLLALTEGLNAVTLGVAGALLLMLTSAPGLERAARQIDEREATGWRADPEEARRRQRRSEPFVVAFMAAFGVVSGYLADGWGIAAAFGSGMAVFAVIVVGLTRRSMRSW